MVFKKPSRNSSGARPRYLLNPPIESDRDLVGQKEQGLAIRLGKEAEDGKKVFSAGLFHRSFGGQ
jgi:hypothetical protein